jgi:pimeloyl-ACP methyl ester carboxylesterase
MPRSSNTRRPSWAKLFREGPAGIRLLAAQLRTYSRERREGTRPPVIVVPAFLAPDFVTLPLRRALRAAGHRAWGWGQGFNMGAQRSKLEGLLAQIDRISWATGEKVALVGWSLGGIYAREAAKRRPDKVATVVTLGTPISHGLRDNNAWKLYEAVNDHDVDHPPVRVAPDEKPPMRTIAVWSAADGIVAPASASGGSTAADEQIEVHCPHNELVSHPEPLNAILSVLEPVGH